LRQPIVTHTNFVSLAWLRSFQKQSLVIVSVIAPFKQTRKEITQLVRPVWVYCSRVEQAAGADYPYEPPDPNEVDVVAV
jgi:hypothetical protein